MFSRPTAFDVIGTEAKLATKYDFTSHYPSNLNSRQSLPTCVPDFHALPVLYFDENPNPKFGIYRVREVTGLTDNQRNIVKTSGYLTHLDLYTAIKLGGKIHLENDDKPNAMLYEKRVAAEQVYGAFVRSLFPLKQKGVPGAKQLLNTLWGAHCQQRKHEMRLDQDETNEDFAEILNVSIAGLDTDTPVVATYRPIGKSMFVDAAQKTARYAPFIVAAGRKKLADTFIANDLIDHVIQCNTDGFITTKPISASVVRTEKQYCDLGELYLEQTGTCVVSNVHDVEWLNSIS